MIIETVFGILLSVASGGDTQADPATMIYKGIITGGKIVEKEKNQELTEDFEKNEGNIKNIKEFHEDLVANGMFYIPLPLVNEWSEL